MRSTSVQDQEKKIKIETTDNQCSTDVWKQMKDTNQNQRHLHRNHLLKKNLISKSSLRVEGVPDEVILKDEEHMKEINEKLGEIETRFMNEIQS